MAMGLAIPIAIHGDGNGDGNWEWRWELGCLGEPLEVPWGPLKVPWGRLGQPAGATVAQNGVGVIKIEGSPIVTETGHTKKNQGRNTKRR